ncbi:carboxylesterase family protein [Streptomyces sp. GMY02]|uniref:carboxylesterase/lipase family protein n=1 Tax=Streptomyces sp. GMY02 TaxID=1333528 RepID=UPI001C2BEB2C|nr:carboxylesterase family protein [Streptomyces sp. GMY02]QXE33255.1 carboxylesterase family protein [Streptomyces sp. GMY02]
MEFSGEAANRFPSRRRALSVMASGAAGVTASVAFAGSARAVGGSGSVNSDTAPVVRTRQGQLEGFTADGVNKFLGVPFAQPPVGELRWRAPKAPVPWSGVRTAQEFGPAAYQGPINASFRTDRVSEDCLYLNVWTTNLSKRARQPVVVWFHGGGNLRGAASEMFTDGSSLAKLGVTVVAPNYRLGPFGFLNDEEMGANFAVLDHVAALRWVRENIEAFGGDPSRVLIFGYSAGAIEVRALLQSPQAKGLFQRCALLSQGGELPVSTEAWNFERSREATERIFSELGATNRSKLREVSAEAVYAAGFAASRVPTPAGGVFTPLDLVWNPVPDGEVVTEQFPAWSSGVPAMFACCQHEGRSFLNPGVPYTSETLRVMAESLAGPKADEVLRILNLEGGTTFESLDRLFTTVIFSEQEYASLRRFSGGDRKLYSYRFQRASPGRVQNNRLAHHGADIFYIFGNLLDSEFYPGGPYDAIDVQIRDEMQHAFVEFARTGVPERLDGARWPEFGRSRSLHTVVNDQVSFAPYDVDPVLESLYRLRPRVR